MAHSPWEPSEPKSANLKPACYLCVLFRLYQCCIQAGWPCLCFPGLYAGIPKPATSFLYLHRCILPTCSCKRRLAAPEAIYHDVTAPRRLAFVFGGAFLVRPEGLPRLPPLPRHGIFSSICERHFFRATTRATEFRGSSDDGCGLLLAGTSPHPRSLFAMHW